VTKSIIAIIRLYKRFISPLLPPACRFTPTCSEYAIEAFQKKSLFKALGMTIMRIMKCHPFHRGGYDPVDPGGEQSTQAGAQTGSS
jgi:putative membrane protein insertion efficiency factor